MIMVCQIFVQLLLYFTLNLEIKLKLLNKVNLWTISLSYHVLH